MHLLLVALAACGGTEGTSTGARDALPRTEPSDVPRETGELLFVLDGENFTTAALNHEGDLFVAEMVTDDRSLDSFGCGRRPSTLRRVSTTGEEMWRVPSPGSDGRDSAAPCTDYWVLGSDRTPADEVAEGTTFVEVRAQRDGELLARREGTLLNIASLSCDEVLILGSGSPDGRFLNLSVDPDAPVLARVQLPDLEAKRVGSFGNTILHAMPATDPPGFTVAQGDRDGAVTIARIDLDANVLWQRDVERFQFLVPRGFIQYATNPGEFRTVILGSAGDPQVEIESGGVFSVREGAGSLGAAHVKNPSDNDESTPIAWVISLFATENDVELEWSEGGLGNSPASVRVHDIGVDRFVFDATAGYQDGTNHPGGGEVLCGSVSIGADHSWSCPSCACTCQTSRLFVVAK